jgi:hypothetical protein
MALLLPTRSLTHPPCALFADPQVSTANLERVRKVKTRHQRLVIRVETLRDELQVTLFCLCGPGGQSSLDSAVLHCDIVQWL